MTSPPYWGLRDYQVAGQYGLEPTVEGYVASLSAVFAQLRRVVRADATVWLNLADTFGGSWGNYIAAGSRARTAALRAGHKQGSRRPPQLGARRKDLQGVPWRVVFALTERGWWLRTVIVWVKPNARPESVTDRLSQRYELVFLLSTSPDRGWAPGPGPEKIDRVWTIAPSRTSARHAAPGPVELARRCILYGCPPAGTVVDPFSGTGTTGVAAAQLGCSYIGIDLDPAATELARARLTQTDPGFPR